MISQMGYFAKGQNVTDPLVEVKNLTRIYRMGKQKVFALREVSLSSSPGTFVVIKGRSGSGKTTLLNLIGGLDQPTSGKVYLNGQVLDHLGERELTRMRRRIGFVFQSFPLLSTLSAYENVELPLRILGVEARERMSRTRKCLAIVELERWSSHRPSEMSGGQRQRVAIARALTIRPILFLADEPTGELDAKSAQQILHLFQRIVSEEGKTIIMATHDPLVEKYADIVYELSDGRVVGSTYLYNCQRQAS